MKLKPKQRWHWKNNTGATEFIIEIIRVKSDSVKGKIVQVCASEYLLGEKDDFGLSNPDDLDVVTEGYSGAWTYLKGQEAI